MLSATAAVTLRRADGWPSASHEGTFVTSCGAKRNRDLIAV
jgi:hypothetical protein